jgi:hypothetical protein
MPASPEIKPLKKPPIPWLMAFPNTLVGKGRTKKFNNPEMMQLRIPPAMPFCNASPMYSFILILLFYYSEISIYTE